MIAIVCFLFTVLVQFNMVDSACKQLGQTCHKTVFDRCCGNTACQLRGFKGKCVRCLNTGDLCARSKECCRGRCKLFRCKDQ
uniref:UPF0506 domain-containing protein n=1 Tax=Trichobilharzia regenti TaxID=157069 RepID=A0AA85J1T1_TRIRE|nr:unnamed protein product [Trichobilharzia regenti]